MIEFKKYDQGEWELMVVRNLPTDFNLEKLIHRVESGIVYEAFKHKTSLYKYRPISKFDDSSWKITAAATGSEQVVNELLLKALEFGADCIYLEINNHTNLDILLKDIRTDFIDNIINLEGCSMSKIAELEDYIKNEDKKNNATSKIYFYLPKDALKLCGKNFMPACRYIEKTSGLSTSLVDICNFFYESFQQKQPIPAIHIHLRIQDYFFNEICRMRSIRILAANIAAMLDITMPEIRIMAHIKAEPNEESIIRQSYYTLASIIGGADNIFGLEWTQNNRELARISQNIQNIYKLESGLDFYKDPANGSFFVEDLTKQITTKAWNEWISHF